MKIKIKSIPLEGMTIDGSFSKDLIGVGDDNVFEFLGDLYICANIQKVGNEVLIKVEVSGDYRDDCSRCLDEVKNTWKCNINLNFEVEQNQEILDITDDLRQEILIRVPAKVLCDKDCKGLCPTCGNNLNHLQCDCEKS